MFRVVIRKFYKSKVFQKSFCTAVTEHQKPPQELVDYEYKILRPFSKDMLISRFNLDIFVFPEIDNNRDLDRVNVLATKLRNLLELLDKTSDEQKHQQVIEQISHSGIFGLSAPELYNGHNYNNMMLAKIMEVVSYDLNYLFHDFIPRNLACQAFVLAATQQQKDLYLTNLVKGEIKTVVAINDLADDFTCVENINTSASYDECKKEYVINGKKGSIKGFQGADYIIVFAKINSSEISPFLVDVKSEGIIAHPNESISNHTLGLTTYDIELTNVRVPVTNLMDKMPGNELARKLATIINYGISSACSDLIRGLLKKSNDFVFNRSIFGRPMISYEVIHHNFCLFTDHAYAAESLAFFVSGFLDTFPSYDTYIESCLAKVSSVKALQDSLNLCIQIMGTKALSSEDSELKKTFDNSQILLKNEASSLKISIDSMKEALEYINVSLKKESFMESLYTKLGILSPRCVRDNQYYLDSFSHNLHPRVGSLADSLWLDFRKLYCFFGKLIKQPEMIKEDLILLELTNIWVDLFTMVVVLTRASRSIAIGLRNHELEVQLVEFHTNRKMVMIKKKIKNLQNLFECIEKDRESAKRLKEMGGFFTDNSFLKLV